MATSTANGTWTYTWDGDNRLTAIEKSHQRLKLADNWLGCRGQKKVLSDSSGNWSLTLERRFLCDGSSLSAITDGNGSLKPQSVRASGGGSGSGRSERAFEPEGSHAW